MRAPITFLFFISILLGSMAALASPEMDLIGDLKSASGNPTYGYRVSQAKAAYEKMRDSKDPHIRKEQDQIIAGFLNEARKERPHGWEASWILTLTARLQGETKIVNSYFKLALMDAPEAIKPKMRKLLAQPIRIDRDSSVPAATSAHRDAPTCAGSWSGIYFYDNPQEGSPFTMTVTCNGSKCSGKSSEPNMLDPPPVKVQTLGAFIDGTCSSDGFVFKKTYDGKGGHSHTVEYSGQFDTTGKELGGKWMVNGGTGGFAMSKK
jgi:hypothetical protein